MRKKIIGIILVVILIFAGFLIFNNNNLTQIGTSKFYLEIPNGFKETKDDFDEDQVAYYYKGDESIDFDVYQWQKEGKYTLQSEADYFAAQYNTTAEAIFVNEIEGMKYVSKEIYNDYQYTVINYMFDDGENIVEICFWTVNNEKELNEVESIINTLTLK